MLNEKTERKKEEAVFENTNQTNSSCSFGITLENSSSMEKHFWRKYVGPSQIRKKRILELILIDERSLNKVFQAR